MTSGTTAVTRQRNPFLIAAAVLFVIALGFAIFYGISWWRASGSQDAQYASAREDVLRVGGQTAINVTSIDYRNLDKLRGELEQSTTGQLHDEVGKTVDRFKDRMGQAKVMTESKLVESAVVNLDTHGNTASVLAVLDSTNKTPSKDDKGKQQQPQKQRLPITVNLSRADQDSPWKASSISGAPMMSGGSGQ